MARTRKRKTASVPEWLLAAMPLNAQVDKKTHNDLLDLLNQLPDAFPQLNYFLRRYEIFRDYDPLVQEANLRIWHNRLLYWNSQEASVRTSFLQYALAHFAPEGKALVARRMSKDPNGRVRALVYDFVANNVIAEVALPATRQSAWDPTGWLSGIARKAEQEDTDTTTKRPGKTKQRRTGVPEIQTVGELRKLLKIKSRKQLGYLLLATDQKNGPYKKFVIRKRDGGERTICAPGKTLRYVQRRILDQILAKVEPHSAANGFVLGKSVLTNAKPHVGAELLLKFDLENFFPTIHGHRVMGLFERLGYDKADGRFGTEDDSRQVAPVLARLCCFTDDSEDRMIGFVPQGAPTSPAISNLICRRLDARLQGLAEKFDGVYTRYADDLTFSFRSTSLSIGRFRWWVNQVCHQEGFHINESKFRALRRSQRQSVTGIVVNESPNLNRTWRRNLRAIMHNCRQHGIASQVRDKPNFIAWLRGQASYLHMIDGPAGRAMLDEIDQLEGSPS